MGYAYGTVNLHNNLFFPTIRSFFNSCSKRDPQALKLIVLGSLLIAFGIYFGLYRFLIHVRTAPILGSIIGPYIGRLLVSKLLEMIYISLLFMTVFSSIVAAFSCFYLDDELILLMVSPKPATRIFWSRFALMFFESSWMVLAFFAPVFLAFASTLNAPWWAYLVYPWMIMLFILTPNAAGAILALSLAAIFPIRQMRKVFQFLSGIVLAGTIIFLRFLQPEKLLNPSYFRDISNYIISLQNPFFSYFPSSWIQRASLALFEGDLRESLISIFPLIILCSGMAILLNLLARSFYLTSWQSSLEAVDNQVRSLEWIRRALIWPLRFTSQDFRVISMKEITVFFRDPSIFSQVFMMGAIIFVYGYNLTILPIRDIPTLYIGELNDTLVYFNGPFIGFILAAISMRFVFPSISIEGHAFWAVKSSPVRPSRILQIKFMLYFFPVLAIGLALCYIANNVFRVTHSLLFWLSFINVGLMSLVITSLAIGLGAYHAKFDSNNPIKIAASYGGFVFMLYSALYVLNLLILQAYPLFRLYFHRFYPLTGFREYFFVGLSFFLLLACTYAWVMIPMKTGRFAIEQYEPG